MNENYTIDVNGLSDIELDDLYARSQVPYAENLIFCAENFSVEFSSLYTEDENKTEQE